MQQYVEWLVEYFSEGRTVSEEMRGKNIFEEGFIDSFGVILLVEAVEKEFGIQFSETHFQDRRFPTINGLAEIIDEIKGDK